MSSLGKLLKWVTFLGEAFLALPIIGGAFVISYAWTPLFLAFIVHAVAVFVLWRERGPVAGNVLGMITSVVGLIPFVGWFMHVITAIVLLFEGISRSRRTPRY
ncbi:hypothetical protein [Paenibacillus tepidiphilus]|uniref:hypothetical protein n=1 Tax=Paenibacillus tepidiphilus TaxID=2608683 RepID=UPI00123A4EDE|nr:hypothetical protein [Paenibacillus tepidiphilus]